jgi:hypothetical protein
MSRLTDILYLLYSMDESDTAKIAKQLNERMRASWVNHVSDLAKQHGCTQLGQTPKGADAAKFKADAKRDAESIVKTYNRELKAEIARIIIDAPKANRNTIIKRLEAWKRRRDGHKIWAIGLNTDSNARERAFQRFYQMNAQIRRQFVAAGPPAVCVICLRIFASGIVDFEFTQRRPLPAHYACPHFYRSVAPQKVDCAKLWVS